MSLSVGSHAGRILWSFPTSYPGPGEQGLRHLGIPIGYKGTPFFDRFDLGSPSYPSSTALFYVFVDMTPPRMAPGQRGGSPYPARGAAPQQRGGPARGRGGVRGGGRGGGVAGPQGSPSVSVSCKFCDI